MFLAVILQLLFTKSPLLTDFTPPSLSNSGLKCKQCIRKPQVLELSRLCPETSTKLYVHEFASGAHGMVWHVYFTRSWRRGGGGVHSTVQYVYGAESQKASVIILLCTYIYSVKIN